MATTSMTMTDVYGTYSIEINECDLSIMDVLEKVVGPLLKAAGYSGGIDFLLEDNDNSPDAPPETSGTMMYE